MPIRMSSLVISDLGAARKPSDDVIIRRTTRSWRERSLMRESRTTRSVPQQHGWSRRDFLERAGLAAGLIGAPGLLAACGESTETGGGGGGGLLEQLKSQGTITVGIAGEKPYAYLDG